MRERETCAMCSMNIQHLSLAAKWQLAGQLSRLAIYYLYVTVCVSLLHWSKLTKTCNTGLVPATFTPSEMTLKMMHHTKGSDQHNIQSELHCVV